ncbi:MAG: hypothetical protein KHZ24_11635 [Coriobacteriia bacterium]|nr:hypothetical protein [Coriobacteriia bacterium]
MSTHTANEGGRDKRLPDGAGAPPLGPDNATSGTVADGDAPNEAATSREHAASPTHPNQEASGADELDNLLRQAFSRERMPAGLAASTMQRIRTARLEAQSSPEASGAGRAASTPQGNSEQKATASHGLRNAQRASEAVRPASQVPEPHSPTRAPATTGLRAIDGGRTDQPVASKKAGRRGLSRRRFVTLMAACLAVGALTAGGAVAFADETARVEVGGAAAVTLGLNRWSSVVRATASDAALQDRLDTLRLTGLTCEDAVTRLASDIDFQRALLDEGSLVLAVTSDSDTQQSAVLDQCRRATQACGARAMCLASDDETMAKARSAGMGIARYEVYEDIVALDPDVTLEQCQNMSMWQLRDLLAAKQAESKGGASSASDASASSDTHGRGRAGGGHGNGAGMGRGRGGQGMGGHGMGMGMGMGWHDEESE